MQFKIGIDEAGRGPWAGPIYIGLVVLSVKQEQFLREIGIKDSKIITPKRRDAFVEIIQTNSLFHTTHYLDVDVIDQISIYKATIRGIEEILAKVPKEFRSRENVMVDGYFPCFKETLKCIIDGDALEISISAASILAKVERDKHMMKLDEAYPQYGFGKHKGYGTKHHMQMISLHGICSAHRKSFKPIKKILGV